MNNQKQKFSELKKQAREAMAGRCGTLVGATAINLFLTFCCSLIPTLIFSGTTLYDIIFLNVTLFLFSLLLSLFQAGNRFPSAICSMPFIITRTNTC